MQTKELKKEIKETIKILVKDLRTLWNLYPYEEIKLSLNLYLTNYGNYWYFIMNEKEITIREASNGNHTHLERKGINNKPYQVGEYLAHQQFINQYEKIRNQVESIQNSKKEQHESQMSKMSELRNKYSDESKKERKRLEASVQIDFPPSINVNDIEITEENGKTIGIIDFGKQLIKIITEGDIVLVDKRKDKGIVKEKSNL